MKAWDWKSEKNKAAVILAACVMTWGTHGPAGAQGNAADTDEKTAVSAPAGAPAVSAAAEKASSDSNPDLTGVSLEDLAGLNVQVVSSSKKAESLRDATSAIFVITQDDIRNSGFQHVADLMRLVPGVQVAQQGANQWAISARGFNDQYNNKMLVLVDGRSVYDPVEGGVNWNQLDLMLEDIDHIEVIRGPGGALWGSNAVNGVVNIITKDSKVTQGLMVSVLGGKPFYSAGTTGPDAVNALGSARFGGKLGEDVYYRVYGQAANAEPAMELAGGTAHDDWYDFRGGFRADLHQDQDQWTFEGEALKSYANYENYNTGNSPIYNPYTLQNFNDLNTTIDQHADVLARFTRDFQDDSEIQVLGYYDYDNNTKANTSPIVNEGTANLEFQHRFWLGSVNEMTWGGSFRDTAAEFFDPINWVYTPENQNEVIYGGFLQDRLTLAQDQLYLTAGAKMENNPYTGWEFQPSGRLLWTPDLVNSFWAGVSRSVRIPTLLSETNNVYLAGIPAGAFGPGTPSTNTFGGSIPNPQLKSEVLVSYELGYRTNPTKETSVDIAAFYNHYSDLVALAPIAGTYYSPAGGVISDFGGNLPVFQDQNTGTGDIDGVEISAKWDPAKNLHLSTAYTYQSYNQALVNASNIEFGAPPPHNMVNGRVNYELVHGLELNTAVYFTDTTFLSDPNTTVSPTPEYTRWDLGADWKATDNLEWSVWGQNLNGAHQETLQSFGVSSVEVVPSLYTQMTLRY